MSLVYEGLAGTLRCPALTCASTMASQSRITLSIGGANLGGPTITQEPSAVNVWLPILTVAVTGPSDTSSCQLSLSAKFWNPELAGATIPEERSAVNVGLPILTVPVTGPSDTSSCQLSLPAKFWNPELAGAPAPPKPPSTNSWPSSSVRISPSGTETALCPGISNVPELNSLCWSGPLSVREPGSITSLFRALPVTPLLRGPGTSKPSA